MDQKGDNSMPSEEPPGSSRPKKKRQWRRKLLAVFGGLAFGFLLAEVVLRVLGISQPFFYAPDNFLGMRFRPTQEGWYTREGRAYVRINRHGWRDRDRSYAKPANTLRIAVLGDSFVEALQIPWQKAFPTIIEDELRSVGELGGRNVEVLSFGKSGFGTTQEYLALRHYVWKYDPDIIVLAFLAGNDVADNHRQLAYGTRRPFFVLKDGRLVLDDSFLHSRDYRLRKGWLGQTFLWVLDWSRVAQVLWEARIRYLLRKEAEVVQPPLQGNDGRVEVVQPPLQGDDGRVEVVQPPLQGDDGNDIEVGLSEAVFMPPQTKVWKEAWAVTEAVLAKMNEEIRQRGARLLVVTLSNGLEVNIDPAHREAFCRKYGLKDPFYPNHRIQASAQREGFAVLHLAPIFQKIAEREQVNFHGFDDNLGTGHWNERGHAEAGRQIAKFIRTHLLGK